MSRRLLVTGGGGMVGGALLDRLEGSDWTIAAPTRSELDLTDRGATTAFVADFRPHAVVHAAGRVGGIQANIAAPVNFLVDNADMGRNIIAVARAAGVEKFVNLASSCVYPRGHAEALREEDILCGALEPTNEGYALAKILVLRLCQYINREEGTARFKTLIPCNLYGPNDHFDPQVSHLLPAAIRKVAEAKQKGSREVEIWGDGTARREFLYVGDLADAIVRSLDQFETLPELMNVGVGVDYSVSEYYAEVSSVIGWAGKFTYNATKPVGMKRKLVDVSRQTEWGWRPTTSLHEGLAATYRGFLEL